MNNEPIFSLPVEAASVFGEHLRVKIALAGGKAVAQLAGAADKAVGHLIQPVNGPEGRDIADIAKIGAVSIHYAVASEAIAIGAEFEAAANGKIADQDAGTALGQAIEAAGQDGDVIRVVYYN